MSMVTLLRAGELSDVLPVQKTMNKLLLAFGGPEFFLAGAARPLFLVDLSLPAEPERGVNFDLRLACALIRLAQQHVKELTLAFRPAAGFTAEQVLQKSGYGALSAWSGLTLLDLSTVPAVTRGVETRLSADELAVAQPLLTADVVISLVKYKAAENQLFGSALHSLQAAAPDCLCDDVEYQERRLVDLYSLAPPDLFIVDAVRGAAGFQPQAADCLLAGTDAVALDAVLATMGGIRLDTVSSLNLAVQYGQGVGDPGQIALYGDDLADVMRR